MIMVNACLMHRAIVALLQIVIRTVGITAANALNVRLKMQHVQTRMILHVMPDIITVARRAKYAPQIQIARPAVRKYPVYRGIIWTGTNARNAVKILFIVLIIPNTIALNMFPAV